MIRRSGRPACSSAAPRFPGPGSGKLCRATVCGTVPDYLSAGASPTGRPTAAGQACTSQKHAHVPGRPAAPLPRAYLGPTADLGAACRPPGLGMWGLLVPLGLTVDRCSAAALQVALQLAPWALDNNRPLAHCSYLICAVFMHPIALFRRGHVTCPPSPARHSTIAK